MERRDGFNVVYSEELSETAILNAIRKGHSYVSAGPELLLTAETDTGKSAMMGDWLPAETTTFKVAWHKAHEGDVLRLIADGTVKGEWPANADDEKTLSLDGRQMNWANVELRDVRNGLWAVTNPIFFGERWS